MKTLKTTNGVDFYVSDIDYSWVKKHKWHIDNYGYILTKNKNYLVFPDLKVKLVKLHRLIFIKRGINIPEYIDHINGNKADNTRSNLRLATNQQNQANSKISKNNKSGYKGVCWDKDNNKWVSQIMFNRKHIKLGRFKTKEDAYLKYCEKAKELFGVYAKI